MTLSEGIERFLEHLTSRRRLSAHTVRAYRGDLVHWAVDLRGRRIESLAELADRLEPLHLRSYLASLHESHAKTSLCRRLSAIRAFLRYARTEAWIRRDVGSLVPSPKAQRSLPK